MSDISLLARGLGKLLLKGDWTFWWGDGMWYDLKAPLNGRDAWSHGEIIYFCQRDSEVRFKVDDNSDNLLSKADQAYLRDIWTRLYYEPTMARQKVREQQAAVEHEARTKGRITELERIGGES